MERKGTQQNLIGITYLSSMRGLLSLCFIMFALISNAQEEATFPGNAEYRRQRKTAARKSIKELKAGVLLVRLDFQQRKIDYFTKYENFQEVERIQKKQSKINAEIADAFNTHYNFCEVYFFRMNDSRKLLQGKYDSVLFFNSQLEPDSSVNLEDRTWFVAEFGYIEQDTSIFYSGASPTPQNEDNPAGVTYYGGSKNNKSALVIRNDKFDQLRDPFPYYVGFNYFGSVKKRYRLPVQKLNRHLHNYFNNSGE